MGSDLNAFNWPDLWQLAFMAAAWLLGGLVPLCGLLSLSYFCLGLPLRRQERAKRFLDLIESGIRDRRRIEETIVSISACRDASLGVRFHLLAAYLEQGLPFLQAVEAVPQLLPVQIGGMLKAGMKIGDLQKVLPACRQLLKDAVSQTRGAINYLFMLAFLAAPASAVVFVVVSIFVLPKFVEVAANMEAPAPTAIMFITDHKGLVVMSQLLLMSAVWLLAFFYVGGPRLNFWSRRLLGTTPDRVLYSLPWRRKRMQRDFSSMLAVLLDAGVPESEALELAGSCTANNVFRQRVTRARANLAQGLKLAQAVEMIDDSGEFRWRLTQSIGRQGGFVTAIAGWKDALDARAFQQEQATAQVTTTVLVLLNGIFVATLALSIFGTLISIINTGCLW